MEFFDKHCHFGNEVEMTKANLEHLQSQVMDHQPEIPYYVCKMGKTTNNLDHEGKNGTTKPHNFKTYLETLPVLHILC
jgi:hypothetical protein